MQKLFLVSSGTLLRQRYNAARGLPISPHVARGAIWVWDPWCRLLSRSRHFYNSFLDWKLFSFVLRAAIAHRYCTVKSHNGKVDVDSTNSRKVYIINLWRHIRTYCSCSHAYIPASTMLQANVMQLNKLLLTRY